MKKIVFIAIPFFILLFITVQESSAQNATPISDSALKIAKRRALEILETMDTTIKSEIWPHINPSLFYANVRNNILYPDKINQGNNNNFCSYAAISHLLMQYQPDVYTKMILSLYKKGSIQLYSRRILKPSKRVRQAAGALKNNGELNVLHADQMWFLSMADGFKGYINLFNRRYNTGDENTLWAASNYHKFNRMLRAFGGYKVHTAGSDLIRPGIRDIFGYLNTQLKKGVVMLYINSSLMYPHRFKWLNFPAPSHFVILYELTRLANGLYKIRYWDYGLKTEQFISGRRLRKTIYGVSVITRK